MKKYLKFIAIALALGFIMLQFFRPTFTNPPIVPSETLEDSTIVPAEVQMVLTRSCNDCHSNKTLHPWYSQITPFNWFLAGHIEDGRRHLNFSTWNTNDTRQKIHTLEEICEMVEEGHMPLPSYLWIHGDAELNVDQRKLLCEWATAEKQRLETLDRKS